MKRTIIFMLLLGTPLYAQKTHNLTSLFNASTQDSAYVTSATTGLTGARVFRSSTSQDTIVTKWIYMEHLNADFTFHLRKVNVAGTDTAQVYCELWRGTGIPDSSGIARQLLVTTNSDTTMSFHLSDSTWVSKNLFSKYRYSVYERAAQQNDYILMENHYSPDGAQPQLRDN